jgi:hypothetical protein
MSTPRQGDQVPAGPGSQVPARRPADGGDAKTSRNGAQPGDRPGQAPAGRLRARSALLFSLSMAQFMVVLDSNAHCVSSV